MNKRLNSLVDQLKGLVNSADTKLISQLAWVAQQKAKVGSSSNHRTSCQGLSRWLTFSSYTRPSWYKLVRINFPQAWFSSNFSILSLWFFCLISYVFLWFSLPCRSQTEGKLIGFIWLIFFVVLYGWLKFVQTFMTLRERGNK